MSVAMDVAEIRRRAAEIRARPGVSEAVPVEVAVAALPLTLPPLAPVKKAVRKRKAKASALPVAEGATEKSRRRRTTKTASTSPPPATVLPSRRRVGPFMCSPSATAVSTTSSSKAPELTEEQQAIIEAACRLRDGGLEALRVMAFAGAGKTYTARQVAERAFTGLPGLYLAFNKSIVTEAQKSFPASVTVKTANGLAWNALGLRARAKEESLWLNGQTILMIVGKNSEAWAESVKPARQATWVAKAIAVFCQSADRELCQRHIDRVLDMVYRPPRGHRPKGDNAAALHEEGMALRQTAQEIIARHAARCLDWLINWRQNRVLPPHEIYLKAFELDDELVRSTTARFAFVALDEAQDLNPVQRSIAVKSGRPLLAIGDPFQQIYSWRGAEDALEHLPGPLLPLSQSFRFGEAIAALARQVLAGKPVKAPTVALRGNPGRQSVVIEAVPGRLERGAVVCRSNAGVFRAAVQAARQGFKVHVAGGIRDVEEEIRSAVALFEGRPDDVVTEQLKRFRTWEELVAEAKDTNDAALAKLVEAVQKGNLIRDLELVRRFHVGSPNAADIVCSTCHKAKGLEWSTVTLWSDWPSAERRMQRYLAAFDSGDQDAVKAALEEWHTYYVAVTRAVDRLSLMPVD